MLLWVTLVALAVTVTGLITPQTALIGRGQALTYFWVIELLSRRLNLQIRS